jgi:hypothetical protein
MVVLVLELDTPLRAAGGDCASLLSIVGFKDSTNVTLQATGDMAICFWQVPRASCPCFVRSTGKSPVALDMSLVVRQSTSSSVGHRH